MNYAQLPKSVQKLCDAIDGKKPKQKRLRLSVDLDPTVQATVPGPGDQTWRKCQVCQTEVMGYSGPCEWCE